MQAQTQTPTKQAPVWNPADFEDVEHIVDADNPNTAFCGVDQTDVPWNQGFPPCEACLTVVCGQHN